MGQGHVRGAVFDLDGHFDIHYRNLDVVDHWTLEAQAGRFEFTSSGSISPESRPTCSLAKLHHTALWVS